MIDDDIIKKTQDDALAALSPEKRLAIAIEQEKKSRAREDLLAAGETPADAVADKAPITAEQCAALDFEPWPAELLALCEPPGNDKWAEISLDHLIFIRVAWGLLRQTKPELVDNLRDMDDETGEFLFDGFKAAIEFHKQAADILEKAELRILVAGSILETTEWAKS